MLYSSGTTGRPKGILRPLLERWPDLDPDAVTASNRKQAVIPQGATVLEPVGTAPGLVVTPRQVTTPTIVVLPGPPRELQTMWATATATDAFRAATAGATTYRRGIARLFGMPESEIANTLERVLNPHGVAVVLEGTHTCMTTRGVHKSHATMVTSRMLGVFRDHAETRQEFLSAIGMRGGISNGG